MSKYNCHLTGQNSDFAKIMAKITHYQPHSGEVVDDGEEEELQEWEGFGRRSCCM